MPAKHLKRITTYVDPEVYELIALRAQEENRTVSNMAATLLAIAAYTGTSQHPDEQEKAGQDKDTEQ